MKKIEEQVKSLIFNEAQAACGPTECIKFLEELEEKIQEKIGKLRRHVEDAGR